jgi:ABC-type nitrate/sulfonate/bicarbonate transport system substrate-binding protein
MRSDLSSKLKCRALLWPMAVAALLFHSHSALAADKLRVGDPSVQAFSFVPLDVGRKYGIFQKCGVDFERISVSGSAKLHQAMTAGSIDIAVGAGSDIAFLVKGAPEMAVAAMAGPPLLFGFDVRQDFPGKTADDLKGKRFGISTVGSLTQWLVLRLAKNKGWSRDDIPMITVGAETPGQTAMLLTKQVDVVVSSASLGFQLEEDKRGRMLFPASDVVKDFMLHAIFASNEMVKNHPDTIRNFLKGWFETIAFMRAHKAATVEMQRARTHFSQEVEDREYDQVMPMFSADGKFSPSAMQVLQQSFVELKILDTEPDLTKYYTEAYLPQ